MRDWLRDRLSSLDCWWLTLFRREARRTAHRFGWTEVFVPIAYIWLGVVLWFMLGALLIAVLDVNLYRGISSETAFLVFGLSVLGLPTLPIPLQWLLRRAHLWLTPSTSQGGQEDERLLCFGWAWLLMAGYHLVLSAIMAPLSLFLWGMFTFAAVLCFHFAWITFLWRKDPPKRKARQKSPVADSASLLQRLGITPSPRSRPL